MINEAPTYGYAAQWSTGCDLSAEQKDRFVHADPLCRVLYWDLRSGTVTAETFCETLTKLPEGITLLLDNARVHQIVA